MKKITIFAALISACSLINAGPQQPKPTLEEYLQHLKTHTIATSDIPHHLNQLHTAQYELESKLPLQVKSKIYELYEKFRTEQTDDLEVLIDAALSFDLKKKCHECFANKNEKICLELEKYNTRLAGLKKSTELRAAMRQIQSTLKIKELLENLGKDFPESRLLLRQMLEVNEKMEQLTLQLQIQNSQK